MKRNWAYKWAKYLEQPKLKQGFSRLVGHGVDSNRLNRKYEPACCLGHLERMVGTRFANNGRTLGEEEEAHYLTVATQKLVGMRSRYGYFKTPFEYNGQKVDALSFANDNSFPLAVIAKIIRERWREL